MKESNLTSESRGVIPGKGGLTFRRQSRFDGAGKHRLLSKLLKR